MAVVRHRSGVKRGTGMTFVLISLGVLIAAGLLSGYLAGVIWKQYSLGVRGDLLLGFAGGVTGGILLYIIGIHYHMYVIPAVAAIISTAIIFYVTSVLRR